MTTLGRQALRVCGVSMNYLRSVMVKELKTLPCAWLRSFTIWQHWGIQSWTTRKNGVRRLRIRKRVKDPTVVPMAIMVVAVVAAGIVQEAEGVVVMVIIPVRRAGAKITAAAIGVGSRATELVTFEANNP
jgi:hypothetical protein